MPVKTPKIKPLTKSEREVLGMITEEFLTLKQIQIRRQCSRQAIYKIVNNLKKKGAINNGLQKVDKSNGVVNQIGKIRLHGQEFNIKILYQNENYQKLLKKSNVIFLEGHTIRLYKNSIELYSGEGTSFYGDTAQEVFSQSIKYWEKFITTLEHNLKVILIKPKSRNIRIVNQHFARGNSEICENAMNEGKSIKVYAKEDGKLAFITDDSFGFKEDETVHPITSKPDREEIDKHVNDWRLNHPPTNSELSQSVNKVMEELPPILNDLKTQIKSHLSLIQEYRKENRAWRKKTESKIRKEFKEGVQTRLNDY